MRKIVINKVTTRKYKENRIRLISDMTIESNKYEVWYEVSDEYEKYLSVDRSDPFVIAFVNYAMIKNLDIDSKVPISESLIYKLNKHYIPSISNSNSYYNNISITSPTIADIEFNAGAVGTGMSAGIDSFSAYLSNSSKDVPKSRRITHLTFFNVGATQSSNTGKFKKDDIIAFEDEEIKKRSELIHNLRLTKMRKIADELGLPLVEVSSNLMEIQKIKHKTIHVQRTLSAVFVLQKLFSKYYFASTSPLHTFKVDSKDPSYFDIFSMAMFSTEKLELLSSDIAYSRSMKTALIKDFDIVKNNLNVCWREIENCGICDKCIRTQVTLDILGVIDDYHKVFDIESFKKNRNYYFAYTWVAALSNPHFKQIIDYVKEHKIQYFNSEIKLNIVRLLIKKAIRKVKSFPKRILKVN